MTGSEAVDFDIYTDEGLSLELALLDTKKRFDSHRGMWWSTDMPIPMVKREINKRNFRLALPIVWKSVPPEILENLLTTQLNCWHAYSTLEGKELKQYMQTTEFVKAMRKVVPHHKMAMDECVQSACRHARILLSDRPNKIKDIIVAWRDEPADLVFSPIASTNPYARVIWLDPILKDAPLEMVKWVVYHEYCTIISMSYTNGRPKKIMLGLLEERFESRDVMVEAMDISGWSFQYDWRKLEQRKDGD